MKSIEKRRFNKQRIITFFLYLMGKFAGFLKRIKQVVDFVFNILIKLNNVY